MVLSQNVGRCTANTYSEAAVLTRNGDFQVCPGQLKFATLDSTMKKPFLNVLGLVIMATPAAAGDLPRQADGAGELILTQLVSAPFPHPERRAGHRYKDQFFSASEHYSDAAVAIFIPPGFRETGQIDFVAHFHGWNNNIQNVLAQYQLIDQFVASKRNAVLIVPQGPRNASDSFGGKLEDPDGFKRFIEEIAQTLRDKSRLKRKSFVVGNIILSGHSGGYHVISAILDRGGMTAHLKEVWLFDALYGQTDKFLAWWDQNGGRLLNIYTEHGGTKAETEALMAQLKQGGTQFIAGNEEIIKSADLTNREPVFLFSALPHDEVVAKHETFREFLETSMLAKRGD